MPPFLAKKKKLSYNHQNNMPEDDHGHKPDKDIDRYKDLLGEAPEECEVCGGHLELEKVNLEDYQAGKLYMMESVPAYVCQECQEIWVPAAIMAEFEKMIETAQHKSEKATDKATGKKTKRIRRVKK
jgi:YgiT-type zinc finger domain-containing protein